MIGAGTAFWLAAARPATAAVGLVASSTDAHPESPAARIAVVRDGERAVLTIAVTYLGSGDAVLLLPMPARGDDKALNVAAPGLMERLDAVSAPRFLALPDPDPCLPQPLQRPVESAVAPTPAPARTGAGVRAVISAERFDAGEPSLSWLAAKDAADPVRWLKHQHVKLPKGAAAALRPYVARHAAFVAARYKLPPGRGPWHLQPIQVALETTELSLPTALGRLTAPAGQAVQIYGLTRGGRIEPRSPPATAVPAGEELPPAVLRKPQTFYEALTTRMTRGGATGLLEYAWETSWCEPCAADPLTSSELRRLGAFWIDAAAPAVPAPKISQRGAFTATPGARAPDAFLTRLLLRYGPRGAEEDVVLETTADRNDVQGRFVARVPFASEARCATADAYQKSLATRREAEAQTLARLTGWDLGLVRRTLDLTAPPAKTGTWVDDLWKD